MLMLIFGIFMVLVYLGVAALLAINFLDWSLTPLWNAVRWFFVAVFACYGIYRGYREIKGEHTYGMRCYDSDTSDEDQYMTYGERMQKMNQNTDNDEKN